MTDKWPCGEAAVFIHCVPARFDSAQVGFNFIDVMRNVHRGAPWCRIAAKSRAIRRSQEARAKKRSEYYRACRWRRHCQLELTETSVDPDFMGSFQASLARLFAYMGGRFLHTMGPRRLDGRPCLPKVLCCSGGPKNIADGLDGQPRWIGFRQPAKRPRFFWPSACRLVTMGGGKKRPYSVLGLQLDRRFNAVPGASALDYATAGSSRVQAPELKNARRSVVKNRRLFLSRDVGFALIGNYQQCFVQPGHHFLAGRVRIYRVAQPVHPPGRAAPVRCRMNCSIALAKPSSS